MSEIRVGDRVWAFSTRKWGKVIDTDSCHSATAMEFEVEFEDGSTSWHGFDDLFFEEIVIPPSARTRPKPKHDLKIDDRVLVRDMGERWWHRHFAGWSDDGRLEAFNNGCTSWAAGGGTKVWEEWKLPDDPKPTHEFKPGDVVLAEGFEGQPELRVFVRSDVGSAVLRNLGTPSYDYEQALSRIQPYNRTLLGFDAVEEKEK